MNAPQPPPPLPPDYSLPPPPGGYPSPPPWWFLGYQPPATPGPALLKEAYTPWITRVGAFIIDVLPVAVLFGISEVAFRIDEKCRFAGAGFAGAGSASYCTWSSSGLGEIAFTVALACFLLTIPYWVWNLGYRQGTTGSSIGKSVLKFGVVSEKTWQPIGFKRSVVRQIAHCANASISSTGFLLPLWDPKRQTLADMIMKTVFVPLNPRPPGPLLQQY